VWRGKPLGVKAVTGRVGTELVKRKAVKRAAAVVATTRGSRGADGGGFLESPLLQ